MLPSNDNIQTRDRITLADVSLGSDNCQGMSKSNIESSAWIKSEK